MANASAAETAYENPLMPNARLQQLYRAMVRMRLLGRALGAKQGGKQTLGLEAALASTSVDLGAGDLISDAIGGGVIEFLRGAGLRTVLSPEKRGARGPVADCGSAGQLPRDLPVQDRALLALGAAAGLKALAAGKKLADGTSAPSGVVVLYFVAGSIPVALLRKLFMLASTEQLPVLFVALRGDKPPMRGGLSAIASQHGIPGMPVDADDAVAIYRVAQESAGHARIGGGPALIECISFVLENAPRRKNADGIANLEQYMLQRGVAKKAWMEQESRSFQKRLTR